MPESTINLRGLSGGRSFPARQSRGVMNPVPFEEQEDISLDRFLSEPKYIDASDEEKFRYQEKYIRFLQDLARQDVDGWDSDNDRELAQRFRKEIIDRSGGAPKERKSGMVRDFLRESIQGAIPALKESVPVAVADLMEPLNVVTGENALGMRSGLGSMLEAIGDTARFAGVGGRERGPITDDRSVAQMFASPDNLAGQIFPIPSEGEPAAPATEQIGQSVSPHIARRVRREQLMEQLAAPQPKADLKDIGEGIRQMTEEQRAARPELSERAAFRESLKHYWGFHPNEVAHGIAQAMPFMTLIGGSGYTGFRLGHWLSKISGGAKGADAIGAAVGAIGAGAGAETLFAADEMEKAGRTPEEIARVAPVIGLINGALESALPARMFKILRSQAAGVGELLVVFGLEGGTEFIQELNTALGGDPVENIREISEWWKEHGDRVKQAGLTGSYAGFFMGGVPNIPAIAEDIKLRRAGKTREDIAAEEAIKGIVARGHTAINPAQPSLADELADDTGFQRERGESLQSIADLRQQVEQEQIQAEVAAEQEANRAEHEADMVDVVYLDPMFEHDEKNKAQVKKDMQAFRQVVGQDDDADDLLARAYACARCRVVVKRARKARPLADKEPTYSLTGKANRFDVYVKAKVAPLVVE